MARLGRRSSGQQTDLPSGQSSPAYTDGDGRELDGGKPTCNRYKYRFRRVALAGSPGGSWTPLRTQQAEVVQDAGYRILPSQTGGFVAVTAPPPS